MNSLIKYKNIIIAIWSLITTISISIYGIYGIGAIKANDFIWIIILIITYFLISKVIENTNKRLLICSIVFSFIISLCAIIGSIAEKFLLENLHISRKDIIVILCQFEALISYITIVTIFIMKNMPEFIKKIKNKKEFIFFTANKKSIVFMGIVFFIAYLPYLLYYYPGNVLIDSTIQIMQGMGDLNFTTHHPPIHTAIIMICIRLGHAVTGSYNFGAFIYTLVQTIITSLLFSFTIYYMAKKDIPVKIRILSALFYALCPTISFLTVTMYKDIPFALSMLALTICMIEIVDIENFINSKIKIILTIIAVFFVCVFRNNGLYAVCLTVPILLLIVKKYKVKIGIIFISGILLGLIVTGPVYKVLGIEKGSSKEAFSVIIQQYARIMKYHENELTEDEKNTIHKYIPIDNIKELYNPVFADPVKSNVSDQAFNEDKITFFKMYLHFTCKYPLQTVASLICNSFGYYYPNTVGWGIYTGVNEECFLNNRVDYGIKEQPLAKLPVLDRINEFVNTRNIPIISMFLSIGFLFWVMIFGIIYCIYTKKYSLIIAYIPLLCMWLTILASPVFGEPRYVYSLFTCLPLLLGISINNKNEG